MTEKTCATCGHHRTSYGGLLCLADLVAKPCESVRDYRGRCGLAAVLWVPMPNEGKR